VTAHLIIEPADRKYLDIQVGELHDFIEDPRWQKMYEDHLWDRMTDIDEYLPETVTQYCDLGGGLSGISILLNLYYGGALRVNVVDGDGPAIMLHHAVPFSSHERTLAFLRNNGVKFASVWHPTNLPLQTFDLMTSFRAWCFHLDPRVYIEWVRAHLSRDGTLLVDVRRDRDDWLAQLRGVFSRATPVADTGKGALWKLQW
jgi:hypothetical protein